MNECDQYLMEMDRHPSFLDDAATFLEEENQREDPSVEMLLGEELGPVFA